MTNRNLEAMPDLGPEWTRDTTVCTPCFDARDATYWLWVEEHEIALTVAAVHYNLLEAPDWPSLRAKAFKWLRANNVDMNHWGYNLPQVMISTGDLLNEVVATHSGVAAKEAKAAAAVQLKQWEVVCSVWNPSFQVTERVSGNDQEVAIDKALALVNANHHGAVVHITHVTEVPTPVTEPPPISREKRLEEALRALATQIKWSGEEYVLDPKHYNLLEIGPLLKSAEETLRGTT